MLTLPSEIILAKNKLGDTTPWLITAEFLLDDGNTTVRVVNNNEDITVDGHTYYKYPFELEPIEANTRGELTVATLVISNANRFLQYYVELYDGCVDSVVNIRIFNNNYKQYAKAALIWQFKIMSAVCTDTDIKFSLGAKNPLLQRFPPYKYYASHCKWKFKSVECAYSGADTTCARTIDACTTKNNTIRFGGYPGLQTGGFRLV